ncbi:MAG: CRTAC1 family protein [Limisphaerales bacterium]
MALLRVRSRHETSISAEAPTVSSRIGQELAARFARFEAGEKHVDETAWAREILAEHCGWTFESLWDSLNAATNKLELAASFPAGEIVLGKWGEPRALPHGIELRVSAGPGPAFSPGQWRNLVEESERAGWQLAQTEFRHNRFETDDAGQPRQSQFYFSAHLTNPARAERAILEGDLVVDWTARQSGKEVPPVKRIDASRLTIKTRRGEPAFRPILTETITPPEKSDYIDPLMLYDLDGDGLSEIILAAKNVVYRRHGGDRYEPDPLCRYPPGLITAAVIADFDGDGVADFLCAKSEGLFLFKGSAQGTFDEPGRLVWSASPHLINAMVLTCGDIDHDGDLDVFVGQYDVPTLGQILRPHYYDANDGHPAYLLLNDGHGNFTDATAAAGLEKKRWRRTYSASFVDLDGDGHLDLVVVSDFAGIDLYRNDGRGRFTDVTDQWVPESHAFGMGHALADFNGDGRLDLLMIGMPSPTVDRLEHLGLWRPDATEDRTMRSRMTFGNRLYLARPGGGFEQTGTAIARSGWSWGCSAFDFDNDGFPDVYIANGMQSKQSVRDYEGEFWLHDIYVGDSVDDVTATTYFTTKSARTRGQGWSYGGYEKNRLYLNQAGKSFVEIGHLMGVALEPDSRNVVTDDLDGDGRVDLLVTTLEVWPEVKQTLRVYKNTLPDSGHWIGFRFREEAGRSPVGVRVTVHYRGHSAVRQIVTGDSHRSQHANTLHFGLGEADRADNVEIQWPNGQAITLRQPSVDRYYAIRPPTNSPVRQ